MSLVSSRSAHMPITSFSALSRSLVVAFVKTGPKGGEVFFEEGFFLFLDVFSVLNKKVKQRFEDEIA